MDFILVAMHVIVTTINHQSIRYAGCCVIRHGIDIKLNSIKRELPASNTTCVRYIAIQSLCLSVCTVCCGIQCPWEQFKINKNYLLMALRQKKKTKTKTTNRARKHGSTKGACNFHINIKQFFFLRSVLTRNDNNNYCLRLLV